MKSFKKQQGKSFYSIIFILIVVGTCLNIGFKLFPAYMDYLKIDNVLHDVVEDRSKITGSPHAIEEYIGERFSANFVSLPEDGTLVVNKQRGMVNVHLNYEIRTPLLLNLDIVIKFDKQYEALDS